MAESIIKQPRTDDIRWTPYSIALSNEKSDEVPMGYGRKIHTRLKKCDFLDNAETIRNKDIQWKANRKSYTIYRTMTFVDDLD